MKERDRALFTFQADGDDGASGDLLEIGGFGLHCSKSRKSCSGPQAYQAHRNWTTVSR
jgi:hypothetical protein